MPEEFPPIFDRDGASYSRSGRMCTFANALLAAGKEVGIQLAANDLTASERVKLLDRQGYAIMGRLVIGQCATCMLPLEIRGRPAPAPIAFFRSEEKGMRHCPNAEVLHNAARGARGEEA